MSPGTGYATAQEKAIAQVLSLLQETAERQKQQNDLLLSILQELQKANQKDGKVRKS